MLKICTANCVAMRSLYEEEGEIIRLPCLVGRVVGPLRAARALPLRCAASTVLSSTLLAI
jgi:hypothetical protein